MFMEIDHLQYLGYNDILDLDISYRAQQFNNAKSVIYNICGASFPIDPIDVRRTPRTDKTRARSEFFIKSEVLL